MESSNQFEITLRKTIPYFSTFVNVAVFVCFLILFLFWIFFIPSDSSKSSMEMKTAYFILAVPEWVKILTGLACLGLIALFPLSILRRKILAILKFDETTIEIKTRIRTLKINHATIRQIILNDIKDQSGFPKGKLQVAINYRSAIDRLPLKIVFILNEYEKGGEIIDQFGKIPDIDFKIYDDTSTSLLD